jgi:alpha-beta hydrolase superfamily lysophospholipase
VTEEIKVQKKEGLFDGPDGLKLYERWWHPEGEPKAVVVIVHGLAEHSGRYSHVAEHLTRNGYAVGALDMRGHGKSEGERVWVESFDEFLDDTASFLARVSELLPGVPTFLMGHSMGGAIVLLYAITRNQDMQGMIVSGASVKIPEDVSPLLQKVSGVMGRFLPKLKTIVLDSADLSRDPEVVLGYDNDPLVYRGGIYARVAAEILQVAGRIQESMEAIKLPLLIMHGTEDKLGAVEGSQELNARVSSTDTTLKLYQGFYHEILNEVEKELVLADLVEWLDAHV